MRMVDLITKKQRGIALADAEIGFFVDGVTGGGIPDYQISAFLMAVYFRGMDSAETASLTKHMAHSGDMVDLSGISGVKVDKHSTGGVGDKTTLIVAPLVAACGGRVAKMSGRGLGHTGGTVDKLESIPGFRTELGRETFIDIVNRIGVSVIGQSGNLAPADKKLYALRDVTGTVQSIPLIASSIMSKKLAAGSDAILLDVKTGSGAFMKTLDDSVALARAMVDIGVHEGRRTTALVTNMDIPLGNAIGNALEVTESIRTLKNDGPRDLTELCVLLAADMLVLSGMGSRAQCADMAKQALEDGAAYDRFRQMVAAQGGDTNVLDHPERFPAAKITHTVRAAADGYITHIDAEACGTAAAILGAGRRTKDSPIDHAAGIVLAAKTGGRLRRGDSIATLYTADEAALPDAAKMLLSAFSIAGQPPAPQPLVLARVEQSGVEYFQNT